MAHLVDSFSEGGTTGLGQRPRLASPGPATQCGTCFPLALAPGYYFQAALASFLIVVASMLAYGAMFASPSAAALLSSRLGVPPSCQGGCSFFCTRRLFSDSPGLDAGATSHPGFGRGPASSLPGAGGFCRGRRRCRSGLVYFSIKISQTRIQCDADMTQGAATARAHYLSLGGVAAAGREQFLLGKGGVARQPCHIFPIKQTRLALHSKAGIAKLPSPGVRIWCRRCSLEP